MDKQFRKSFLEKYLDELELIKEPYIMGSMNKKKPMTMLSKKQQVGMRPVNKTAKVIADILIKYGSEQGWTGPYSVVQIRLDPSSDIHPFMSKTAKHGYGVRLQFASLSECVIHVGEETANHIGNLPLTCMSWASGTGYTPVLGYLEHETKQDRNTGVYYRRFHFGLPATHNYTARRFSVRMTIDNANLGWPTDANAGPPLYGINVPRVLRERR